MEMTLKKIVVLIGCILLPLGVGGLSGYLTSGGITDWYQYLNKPFFNPPNYLFGFVWPILYFLMGISLFLLWLTPSDKNKQIAFGAFALQLALNFFWSFLFFNFRQPLLALAEILILWGCILWMIREFRQIRPLAAWMQVPYLLWVSFATLLNAAIWWLN